MICRILPLIGVVLFLGVGLGGRAWLHARRYGACGIVLFRGSRRGQDVRDSLLVLLLLLLTGQALLAAGFPAWLPRPAFGMSPATAVVLCRAGAALLSGGLALLLVAQLNLGASWRIGIEEAARPGLVTGGLYRFCRNPIFLFMLVMFVGYALLLPTWLSAGMLVGAFVGVRQQVIAEEAYLSRVYGDQYRAYAGRVGRFLPWVGRLR